MPTTRTRRRYWNDGRDLRCQRCYHDGTSPSTGLATADAPVAVDVANATERQVGPDNGRDCDVEARGSLEGP